MKKFLKIVLVLFIFFSPFYIFQSGLPQPADIIIAFGGLVFFFSKDFWKTFKLEIVKKLFRFILLTSLVNFIYWFYYEAILGVENKFYFSSLFYIFNFLFFIMYVSLLKGKDNLDGKSVNLISFVIILTVSLQFVLAILGIGSSISMRGSIFFNNPNQLGYFALLMLSLFTILPSSYRKNIFLIIWMISSCGYLVLYSGSRAALGGILLLAGMIFYLEGFKLKIKSVVLILILFISIPIALKTNFVNNQIESVVSRNDNEEYLNVSEAQIRGYDRFLLHPEYIFYGAGEGLNERFNSLHQLEMHSGFGNVLFSYGILGFILFIIFFRSIVKTRMLFYGLLLTPIIVYNLTHQGFRDSLFWAVLASVFLVKSSKSNATND